MELREIERRHFALNPEFNTVRVKTVQTQSSQDAGANI